MLITEQFLGLSKIIKGALDGCDVSFGFRTRLDLGMTEKTFVLIKGVFFTPKTAFVFQLRMTQPATIFVASMLRAPKASFFAL